MSNQYIIKLKDKQVGDILAGIITPACIATVALASLSLMIDAVARISKCSTGDLAVSKTQIWWHIGGYSLYFVIDVMYTVVGIIFYVSPSVF